MPTKPAILGTARLGNFRLGYETAALAAVRKTRVTILIAGVLANTRVRVGSSLIRDILNDAPNTCDLTVDTSAPSVSQDLRVLVNSDAPVLLFNGQLQTVDLSYEGKAAQTVWPCTAIDDTARANYRRPFGTWTNVSATIVAQSLIAVYAPGFTATHVQAALPAISVNFDGSEGMSGCLRQIAKLIGGYFYFEDLDLHLFQTEASSTPDPLDSTPGRFLDDPPIKVSTDMSQLRTRVYGRGMGSTVASAIAVGATTIPVDDQSPFSSSGGSVINGSQVITYTGLSSGSTTAQGGPGSSTVAARPAPTVTPVLTATADSASFTPGAYQIKYVFIYSDGSASMPSTASAQWTFAGTEDWHCASIGVGDSRVTDRKVYEKAGSTWTTEVDDANVGAMGDNTATVKDIHLGADGTHVLTSAASYAAGATYIYVNDCAQFLTGGGSLSVSGQTLTYTGRSASSGVGALTGVSGVTSTIAVGATIAHVTPAGATSLAINDTASFSGTGGTARTGSQTFTYTGRSTSSGAGNLTGIPSAGAGSLGSAVSGGDTVLVGAGGNGTLSGIPASGVGSVLYAINLGDAVNIFVQRDDLTAQATYGIIEHLIADERRGIASLNALCDADLVLFSTPIVTVLYATRDTKTKSGKTIVVNLTTPPISRTLTIQDVTITEIDVAALTGPKFTVTASSVRFSLEDLIRRMAA